MLEADQHRPVEEHRVPITSRPYSGRQFVVVVDDALVEEAKKWIRTKPTIDSKEPASKIVLNTSYGLLSFNVPFPLSLITIAIPRALMELAKSLTRLREEGIDVLTVCRSESTELVFPPGHPRDDIFYVGHPAFKNVYFPASQFHRSAFEHKVSEAVKLLMALGACEIEINRIKGWIIQFSAELGMAQGGGTEGDAASGGRISSNPQLLFKTTLSGNTKPEIPSDLVWYPHEPTWQQMAEGRTKHGLKDFVISVRYEDDYGVNAGLRARVSKVGLDLGGQFEGHEPTIWRIVGKFA